MAETARFEPRDLPGTFSSHMPELLDLTEEEALSDLEQKNWFLTPQQRLNRIKSEYPEESEATLRRRLRKGLELRPVKAFYSSHYQASLHLAQIDQSQPNWDAHLVSSDQSSSSTDSSNPIIIDLTEAATEPKKPNPEFRGSLLHPLSAADHPPSFSSIESKKSCISDAAWFPVLDAVARFFSDTTTISSGITPGFSALMEMNEQRSSISASRRPPRQSAFCIESGLNDEWIGQLRDLWTIYPSQMLLFIEKQMVMALREVRTKLLNAASPPSPWTFWRRPDTPLCGLATPNDFNPESPDSWRAEEGDMSEGDILSPTLVNELTSRKSKFVVPAHGVPLGPMDALSLAVLHRVMNYWEIMRVKIKPLAQIVDSLIDQTSRHEYFSSLFWMDSTTRPSDASNLSNPSISYYSYNPFSLPHEDTELRFERIFQLLFRTVILRHYSIRACLRRACFINRQLFSLDQPQEVAELIRIRNFESDVRFLDEYAWSWKFRLSIHHYINSSRVSHDISQYPIVYSPLVMSLLAPLKDSPRQRQGDTLSLRWPILTANHLQQIAQHYPTHRFYRDRKTKINNIPGLAPVSLLEFPPPMPLEWRLLKGEAIAHPRLIEVIQKARRRSPSLYDFTQLEDEGEEAVSSTANASHESNDSGAMDSNDSHTKSTQNLKNTKDTEDSKDFEDSHDSTKNHESASHNRITEEHQSKATMSSFMEDDQFNSLFKVPDAVAGYVTPTILTTILQSHLDELDEEWSDDSDADYPEDDEDDPNDFSDEDDYGASEGSAFSEHSEYEYYDSEEHDFDEQLRYEEDKDDQENDSLALLKGEIRRSKSSPMHKYRTGNAISSVSRHHHHHKGEKHPSFSTETGVAPDLELPDFGNNPWTEAVDWSLLDAALVETVMEAKSKEEVAKLIALRLGISGGKLPYEIADLIPATFLQRTEAGGSTRKNGSKSKKLSSAVSASSAYHDSDKSPSSVSRYDERAIGRAETSGRSNRTARSGQQSENGVASLPPVHGVMMGSDGYEEWMDDRDSARSHLERAMASLKDGNYQSPFGPEAANGLALPVPAAPPPPPPHTRRAMLLARTLTQPFDSDDDADADDDFPADVVFNPSVPPARATSPTYPYSVAARLHDLRMSDPYEGSSMYKLKTTPNFDEAAIETPQARAKRAQAHSIKAQAMLERRAAAAAAAAPKIPKNGASTTPTDPRIPGIADTTKSLDELLEFIEGPSTKSNKGSKKKNDKKSGTPSSSSSSSSKSTPHTVENSNTSSEQSETQTTATKTNSSKNTNSSTAIPLPSDSTLSGKNHTKNNDTTTDSTTQGKGITDTQSSKSGSIPGATAKSDSGKMSTVDEYPDFWSSDDLPMNSEQRKALDDEITLFQNLLEQSYAEPLAPRLLFISSNGINSSQITNKKPNQAVTTERVHPPQNSTSPLSPASFKLDGAMFASIASKSRTDTRNVFKRVYSSATTPSSTSSSAATSHHTTPSTGKSKHGSKKRR